MFSALAGLTANLQGGRGLPSSAARSGPLVVWWVAETNLHEPRLERELRVAGFAQPPASDRGKDIPVVRFPRWVSCPECKRLARHGDFTSMLKNDCELCGQPLVPSRFVIACEAGHIEDFPYFLWVHKGAPRKSDMHEMKLETGGLTAGLGDIEISCSCGETMTMEGSFERNAMMGITECKGKRPWLQGEDQVCSERPRTLQRGASNVWFSVTRSALSIPPWSKGAFRLLNRHWPVIRVLEGDLAGTIEKLKLADGTPYSVEDLVEAVKLRRRQESEPEAAEDDLRRHEYEALVRGADGQSKYDEFVCQPGSLGKVASEWLDKVMLVGKLREVRVLQSFTRVRPPGPSDSTNRLAPLFDDHPGWYPAIEVIGEGVFLRIDESRLTVWEQRPDIIARANAIDENYRGQFDRLKLIPDRTITPRFLLLHSFAHAVINQWALDSGYPAASLRERLYAGEGMAGILVYTGSTDSAGSLGGVVGQAEPERLDDAITEAIARASWCSSDPVCIESDPGGVDALNLAACHCCLLLPEVSCEEHNVLLDRGMLVGTQAGQGFFDELLPGA